MPRRCKKRVRRAGGALTQAGIGLSRS